MPEVLFKAKDPIAVGAILNQSSPRKQLITDKFGLCRHYIINKRKKRAGGLVA